MSKARRYILSSVLAALLAAVLALAWSSVRTRLHATACTSLEITFADSLHFVSKADIKGYLDSKYGNYIGQKMDSVQLYRIEEIVSSRSSVTGAEAWITDDGVLHLKVSQRAPSLRFEDNGRGFYVDAGGYIFPLHPSYTADVPLVRGRFPVDIGANYRGEAQTAKERQWISQMLEFYGYVSSSRRWASEVSGVRSDKAGELSFSLESAPGLKVIFGRPENIRDKFARIDNYFNYIVPNAEDGPYKTVNVKYNNQIICRKKDIW